MKQVFVVLCRLHDVGCSSRSGALVHVHRGGGRISSSASRNESVDSAPWFSFRPLGVQPVAAAAGRRVVEPLLQLVLPEKPVERPPPVDRPSGVARSHGMRRGTPRPSRTLRRAADRTAAGQRAALIEAVRSDRRELLVRRRLQRHQPFERSQAGLGHVSRDPCVARDDERLRQARVAVGARNPRTTASPAGSSAETGRAAARPASTRRASIRGCRPGTPAGTRRCRAARRPRRAGS